MQAGRELDALIAKAMDREFRPLSSRNQYGLCSHCGGVLPDDPWERLGTRATCDGLCHFSTDIAAAWTVDRDDWHWVFFEVPNRLQITLYPTRELWDRRPGDCEPYPAGVIFVDVPWSEC